VQVVLLGHIERAAPLTTIRLERPLSEVPAHIAGWRGQDLSADGPGYPRDADDKLHREYVLQEGPDAGLRCRLWAVHFRDGSDRAHHPVICQEVAGFIHVTRRRAAIALEGRDVPVERFCFTRRGATLHVFYWHYTLEPPPPAEQSILQRIYQPRPVRWPSVTFQVFTAAGRDEELDAAAAFVRRVDHEMRAHLPPYARMGSDLLPVRLIRE
jgi:hypothetical protein